MNFMKNHLNNLFKISTPLVILLFLDHADLIAFLEQKYIENQNSVLYDILTVLVNETFHWAILSLGVGALLFQYKTIYNIVRESKTKLHIVWKYHFYILMVFSLYLLMERLQGQFLKLEIIPKFIFFSDFILIWNLSSLFNIIIYFRNLKVMHAEM